MKAAPQTKKPARELIDVQFDLARRGDPVRFLTAFLDIQRRPYRYAIGWDYETLDHLARSFGAAATAAIGRDRLREACLAEQRRYDKLARDLRAGEHERGQIGFLFLNETGDWAEPVVIAGALQVLQLLDARELVGC